MKMCQPHWNELRKAIDDRGMSHLVAKSGKDAVARAVSEIEGTDTVDTYDPLMSANWMIFGRVIELAGLGALQGDLCPLCLVEEHEAGLASQWIYGCTDSILNYCIELGIMENPLDVDSLYPPGA